MISDFLLICKMVDISRWELKNEAKKIAKQKVEEFCKNKYNCEVSGNETLKNIIMEDPLC